MPRRLVPALLALAAIAVWLVIASCGSDSNKAGSVQAIDANCGDVEYQAVASPPS